MKSVGLLSLPRYDNYGSQLQLHALQIAITELGYRCEVIDYVAPPPPPLSFLERLRRVVSEPSQVFGGMKRRRFEALEKRLTGGRRALFQGFTDELLDLAARSYATPGELVADPPAYDACVVGSDQVWNPMGHFGDATFFLAFTEKSRRVAYAPSIGVSTIPEHAKAWMREQIDGVEWLSVREEQGARLIHELTGREALVVTDPTLLHVAEHWDRISIAPARARPYLLLYALQSDRYVREWTKRIADANGLEVVVLPFHREDVEGETMGFTRAFDVGPREFLGLVRDAAFVCTDSFHGTVFSVIHRRPFYSFRRYDHAAESATFSRMEDFLARLGLQDRGIGATSVLPADPMAIDYTGAATRLDAWRGDSWAYLANALREASTHPVDGAE